MGAGLVRKRPTFSPSLRCRADWWNPETKRYDIKLCCHFFLRNGRLEPAIGPPRRCCRHHGPIVVFGPD